MKKKSSETKIFSFRFSIDLIDKVDKKAKVYDRSRNYMVEKAIEKLLGIEEPLNEADKLIQEILNKNES